LYRSIRKTVFICFIIVTSWPTINKFETLLSKQNKKSYLEYFQKHLPCNELRKYIR